MNRDAKHIAPECQLTDKNEKNRRFIQDAIELALSLGDFQKEMDYSGSPKMILSEAALRIERLIAFDVSALYLIDEESADLQRVICTPDTASERIENEMAYLIDSGFLAWAMRERRGVSVFSKDGSHQILLHVMATYSHIRGMFIGCFPPKFKQLPDGSKEILSIVLRNSANVLESLNLRNLMKKQNSELEHKVDEKTQSLVRFERQLMQAQKMEAIVALAGGVAHQFNNALAGLIGFMELLALGGQKAEDISAFLQSTQPITEKMTGLTKQLLAYAQEGYHKPQRIALEEVVKGVLPVLRQAVKPAIWLETAFEDEPVLVNVDVTQFQMVLSAVVNNADEAMEGKGILLIRSSKATLENFICFDHSELLPGVYACLSIQDNGKGMDQNTLRRLFEPFFTTKFEGRGLSMAAVYGIVKNHQGAIHVESQLGQGTLVQIFLPVQNG